MVYNKVLLQEHVLLHVQQIKNTIKITYVQLAVLVKTFIQMLIQFLYHLRHINVFYVEIHKNKLIQVLLEVMFVQLVMIMNILKHHQQVFNVVLHALEVMNMFMMF